MNVNFTKKLLVALSAIVLTAPAIFAETTTRNVSELNIKANPDPEGTQGDIFEERRIWHIIMHTNDDVTRPDVDFFEKTKEGTTKLYIKTNALYWLGGLMNVGLEYCPESCGSFSFVLNGGFSPFYSKNWKRNMGGWFVSPEVRYYLGRRDRGFVGAQYMYSNIDVRLPFMEKMGVTETALGRDGSVNSFGLVGGYKLPLTKRCSVDFTLGIGASHFKCDLYDVVRGNYVALDWSNERVVVGTDDAWRVTPIQLGVNFGWDILK